MCIRDRAGPHLCASNPLGMERAEAEAVYEQGRETVVAVLLELSAQNALLRREVADLRERVAQPEERIAELERRLNRNSRNSSLPPSQDPPAAPERRQAPPSGRGRGAQPGHSGHGRHLAPVSYTHLRAHETRHDLVCRLLLEKKKRKQQVIGI